MSQLNIEIETKSPSTNLLLCAVAIKQSSKMTRAGVAKIIREHNYIAHEGGRHVAITDLTTRLAIVTSKTLPDFN